MLKLDNSRGVKDTCKGEHGEVLFAMRSRAQIM